MIAHRYKSGDAVAVFDTRRERWISGRVVDATSASALVATASWRGLYPADPRLLRPVHLVAA